MDILKQIKKQKIIGLAPMAGYTDSPFRQLCKEYGADLVYTEMISALGLIYEQKSKKKDRKLKSLELSKFEELERPIFVQIFGREPKMMAEAAKIIINEFNPDGIDINMGCPARKVVASFNGSSLMREPKLAGEIVKEVRNAIGDKILSVKTRLGWDNKNDIFEFAKIIEKSGADILAIHCRTKAQGFSGDVDWGIIKDLKKIITIPILINGGVKDWKTAEKCLELSNADGILIGQASLGKPWIFNEIKSKKDMDLSLDEVKDIVLNQINLHKGDFTELRKHLIFYFKGFKNSAKIRTAICTCKTKEEFLNILNTFNDDGDHHDHEDSS